jgi:PX domain
VAAQGLAPRWTPFSVAKKPEQIERRRRELEAWLWRLIGDPRTARSRVLNQFLELSDAARMARWALSTIPACGYGAWLHNLAMTNRRTVSCK